jgi:hypothetical protein
MWWGDGNPEELLQKGCAPITAEFIGCYRGTEGLGVSKDVFSRSVRTLVRDDPLQCNMGIHGAELVWCYFAMDTSKGNMVLAYGSMWEEGNSD